MVFPKFGSNSFNYAYSISQMELMCAWLLVAISVEAKLHGESKVIQRCFDDNNDDNKR